MKTKRLYPEISPISYTISLRPDLKKFTFNGEETFTFSVQKPTTTLTLHAYEIEIQKAVLKDNGEELVPQITYNTDEKTVLLTFPHQLTGEHTLYFSYKGLLGEKMKGFYRSAYAVGEETRYMAVTQFEEIGARQAFIGIDEPAAKAIFDITLIVPKHLTAISNTISQEEVEINEGFKKVHFLPTPTMSPYSVAFIVGEFESLESLTKNNVLIRVFVTPGKKQQAEFALSTAEKMLTFYEEYFDIAYPLPSLDLIAIPDFDAGAMENWGAVTFREVALLVDNEKTSIAAKQWVALVIAHELAHMWFGNLVTMEWWTHLWLNEGFASYIEYFATDKLFPQWNMWDQFFALDHNAALALDGLKNTHPIEVDVPDVDLLKEIFDEISYAKGASIIAMLATYLGEVGFRDGLRHYLKKHAYGNAVTENLWDSFEEVSQKPVRKIMQQFTKKPGYPVVHVGVEKNHLHLIQKRFFASAAMQSTPDATVWNIPFSVISSEAIYEKDYLMEEKTMDLPKVSTGNFIKLNAHETSFFRTIYAQQLYEELQKGIVQKTFSARDRMGILRDAFDGAEAGILSVSTALLLVSSYTKETSYSVWSSISTKLGSIYNVVTQSELEQPYKEFAKGIFAEIAQQVGWKKEKGETTDQTLLRTLVVYAYGKYGDTNTIATAKELFWKYINSKETIDSDIRGVVYMLLAENADEDAFYALKTLYTQESLAQEKNRIGNALMSFRQETLITKALDFALSSDVRLQDMPRFFILGFANEYAREITWEFFKKNWEKFQEKFQGQHGLGRLIEGAASITSPILKKDIQMFFQTHPTSQLSRTVQQVLEQIEANIAWKERDFEKIALFLQKTLDSKN